MTLAVGVILVLMGLVWVLQGLDVAFAPQSFMTGDPWWVVFGGVAILAGIGLVWRGRRHRTSDDHADR
jgi:LPXTG-motif cell wall-anchored protein